MQSIEVLGLSSNSRCPRSTFRSNSMSLQLERSKTSKSNKDLVSSKGCMVSYQKGTLGAWMHFLDGIMNR